MAIQPIKKTEIKTPLGTARGVFVMKEREEGLNESASLPRPIPDFERFPSTESSMPGPERPNLRDELKEVPGTPESSAARARETVTVFESIRPAETEPPRAEHSSEHLSIHPSGNPSPQESPLLLYWNAFKPGLKYKPVSFGYMAFAGVSLFAGTAASVLNTTNFELYLAGPLVILLPTLYRHYREPRSYIQATGRPVQKPSSAICPIPQAGHSRWWCPGLRTVPSLRPQFESVFTIA